MRDWLLQRYSASTFNICPHKSLTKISGPFLKFIQLEDTDKPRAFHTPAHVPINWQKQFNADLIRVEKLDVLEDVQFGEPLVLFYSMVVTRKQDGSPRRTEHLKSIARERHVLQKLRLNWHAEFQKEHSRL